jgi:hypothetical protein
MDTIEEYKNTKTVCPINKFINSFNMQVLFTYDNEEFDNPHSFKGSLLPHKLLVFEKYPLPILENEKTLNKILFSVKRNLQVKFFF